MCNPVWIVCCSCCPLRGLLGLQNVILMPTVTKDSKRNSHVTTTSARWWCSSWMVPLCVPSLRKLMEHYTLLGNLPILCLGKDYNCCLCCYFKKEVDVPFFHPSVILTMETMTEWFKSLELHLNLTHDLEFYTLMRSEIKGMYTPLVIRVPNGAFSSAPLWEFPSGSASSSFSNTACRLKSNNFGL